MVFELEKTHNLGRWVQPTLSMVFWYGWAKPTSYAELNLPRLSSKMALLDGHTIFLKKEYESVLEASRSAIEKRDGAFFDRLCHVSEKNFRRHWELGEKFKKRPEPSLAELFGSWHELCVPWTLDILCAIPLEKALEEKILEEKLDPESAAEAVASTEKTPLMRQNGEASVFAEKIGKMGISMKTQGKDAIGSVREKDAKLAESIEKHLEEFAWVGTHHLWGKRFDISALIEQMASGHAKPSIAQKFTFSRDTSWIIRQSQRMAYWRQALAEASDMAAFWARPKMQKTAKQLGLTYDDLIWLLDTEILSGLGGQKIPRISEINLRKKAFGIVEDPLGVRVIVGAELQKWLSALVPAVDADLSELKGTAASPGLAEGIACVCLTPHDAEKLRIGQILVVPQTTPDFVPYMRKASAIVTEEGGLTCHAAIVSRELGKPCVVGTKIATRVVRNGEKIRVDAGAGKIFRLEAKKASH